MKVERLAAPRHVTRNFKFNPVSEKKSGGVMEDNEMIISVFLRHNFTANCNGKAEDRETS